MDEGARGPRPQDARRAPGLRQAQGAHRRARRRDVGRGGQRLPRGRRPPLLHPPRRQGQHAQALPPGPGRQGEAPRRPGHLAEGDRQAARHQLFRGLPRQPSRRLRHLRRRLRGRLDPRDRDGDGQARERAHRPRAVPQHQLAAGLEGLLLPAPAGNEARHAGDGQVQERPQLAPRRRDGSRQGRRRRRPRPVRAGGGPAHGLPLRVRRPRPRNTRSPAWSPACSARSRSTRRRSPPSASPARRG